jgi:hypothetical protein
MTRRTLRPASIAPNAAKMNFVCYAKRRSERRDAVVLPARKVIPVLRAIPAILVTPDSKVILETLETLDLRETLVIPDPPDRLDLAVLLDLLTSSLHLVTTSLVLLVVLVVLLVKLVVIVALVVPVKIVVRVPWRDSGFLLSHPSLNLLEPMLMLDWL